ncbi:BTAD domain-containing putative transcriptional regulator [Streptomyces olivoreticuli]
MRYGILGTTQAHSDDGRPTAVGGPRLRALLAALALHPGRTRTTEALIDAVWDGEPPADAAGALQALVGRLRRALGADAVASADGGYRLCAEPGDVDLHRFRRLADEGAAALAAADPERAAVLLGEALALWRGPVLADLPGRSALAGRYEAAGLDARRGQLAAAVALGRAERILPELAELCADHPLDEPFHALHLRALRAAGRPAEALAAYETVRTAISDRLGADPGPELRSLHAELLAGSAGPSGGGEAPHQGGASAPDGTPAPRGALGPGAAPMAFGAPASHGALVQGGAAVSSEPRAPRDAPEPGATPEAPGAPASYGAPAPHEASVPRVGPGPYAASAPQGTTVPRSVAAQGGASAPYGAPASGEPRAPHGASATSDAPASHDASVPRVGPGPYAASAPQGTTVPRSVAAQGGASAPYGAPASGEPRAPHGASATSDAPASHDASAPRVGPGSYAASAPQGTAVPRSVAAPHGTSVQGNGSASYGAPASGEALAPQGAPVPYGLRAPHGAPALDGGPAARQGNLRARLTSFVGREGELELIRGDLGRHRLVTLLGPGGAGKTRLSQEAAEAAAAVDGSWPDGVWLAELAPVDDPGTVPEAVLTALGARETVVRGTTAEGIRAAEAASLDPLDRLAEHCAPRRMLLVLDNCEHVVDAAARLAETLLAHCPDVTVLATSREPLAVPGELVRPVEPLPDPVALRLLADRGAAARPGFRVEADPEACAEICRRLDGLPLAIELAAARLRMLTPRGLADRLDDRFRLLTSGSRTVLPRQQTLRAVVDWSWDLLDAPERAVLRRLSVFSGGCDLAEAEEVCSGGAVGSRDVAALLGSLVDKSLVVAAPATDGDMRYRLLETVGEYAAERLDEAGERAAVERRHLVAYRELARTADPLLRGPAQRTWLDRLELEHDNLRSALRRAVAARDEQEALCMVLSLTWFWQLRDHRSDVRTWADAAAALGPDPFADPVEPAPPLYVGCTDAPPPMSPELLTEARRCARMIALANAESNVRVIGTLETQRRVRGVLEAYGEGQPQNCRVPGFLWFFAIMLSGDFEAMDAAVNSGVERCRELGYEWELAHSLQLRAKILNDRKGRLEQGARDAEEALEIFRRLGDAWGVAEALSGRGEAYERRGEFTLAADAYREAVDQVLELGALGEVPALRGRMAEALMESGAIDAVEGERLLRQAIGEADKANPEASAFARVQLATRIARDGRTAEAREIFDELMADFTKGVLAVFQSMMHGQIGWLDILEGKPAEALPRLRTGLAMTGDPLAQLVVPQLAVVQLKYAALAYAELGGAGRAVTAARLLGASEALRPTDFPPTSFEREVMERAEAGARPVLGDAAYERAYAEGGGLTLEEATALV